MTNQDLINNLSGTGSNDSAWEDLIKQAYMNAFDLVCDAEGFNPIGVSAEKSYEHWLRTS